MTDLHDINTRNDSKVFRSIDPSWRSDMDTICVNCGKPFGDHSQRDCPPDDATIDDEIDERTNPSDLSPFWECYVQDSDGGRHYRHYSIESAQAEAERLARLPTNQGKDVYIYQFVGRCKVEQTPIRWEVPR